jgi:hypothetical protein
MNPFGKGKKVVYYLVTVALTAGAVTVTFAAGAAVVGSAVGLVAEVWPVRQFNLS